MKKTTILGLIVLLTGTVSAAIAQDVKEGEKLFKQVCVACHTIGQGRLIGPDLANVHKRRPMSWLIQFIQSSQSVIKKGDPYAQALFEEYNRMVMPDQQFSADQIRAIISYIAENSPGGPGHAATGGVSLEQGKPMSEASMSDIERGKNLFQGIEPFSHRGPSCNSCHNVNVSEVLAGGALAKDLTDVYSRLREAGIKAILHSPPFPAMKQAYTSRSLTEEEIFALTAFLAQVDREAKGQQRPVRSYLFLLFALGLGGALILLLIFGGAWLRSKHASVNAAIYQRQIQSM